MEIEKAPRGMAIDSAGSPVIDPTLNVLQLVEAAVKRLDDLANQRSEFIDRLMKAETLRLNDLSELRATYIEKLSAAESRRIDAIRAVDVGAVAIASERNAQQSSVLANQVATTAETLRTLVSTTAAAIATQNNTVVTALSDRISSLEKTAYVGTGRQALTEPMLTELATEIKNLGESRERREGATKGASVMWAYGLAGVMAFLSAATLIFIIVHAMTSK